MTLALKIATTGALGMLLGWILARLFRGDILLLFAGIIFLLGAICLIGGIFGAIWGA